MHCAKLLEIRYPWRMISHADLISAAYHAERVASRRLAKRHGIDQERALRTVLETAAGAQGLPVLLAARAALKDAARARRLVRSAEKAAALALKMRRHEGPAAPWNAWFDGSAHPNPGRCGIGGIVTGPGGERIDISQPAGHGNSSEAEYLALIAVLQAALGAGARQLTVYGDSQGVIADERCPIVAGAPSLRALRAQAQALVAELGNVSLHWVPRHKNLDADALSQRAIAALGELSAPAAPAPHRGA